MRIWIVALVAVCLVPAFAQSPFATPGTFTCLQDPDQHVVESESACIRHWYENLGITGKPAYFSCKTQAFTFTTPPYYNGTVLFTEGDHLNTSGCGSNPNPQHWINQAGQATGTLQCPGNSIKVVNGNITSCTCSVGEKWDDAGQTCILPTSSNGGPYASIPWTPTVLIGSTQQTISANFSTYQVTENEVQIEANFTIPTISGTGYLNLEGLPLPPLYASGQCGGGGTVATNNFHGTVLVCSGSSNVVWMSNDTSGGGRWAGAGDVSPSNDSFVVSFHYFYQ